MLGDERKHLACGKQLKFTPLPPGGPRDSTAQPGSHVIMFSVGRFTCNERVMLIEREIRLLFCVNKWCFVTCKHVMRQSSMANHETFMTLSEVRFGRFLLAFAAATVV